MPSRYDRYDSPPSFFYIVWILIIGFLSVFAYATYRVVTRVPPQCVRDEMYKCSICRRWHTVDACEVWENTVCYRCVEYKDED